MWEKLKESKFGKKCRELSHNGGFMVVFVCVLLTLTVVVSVSVATNRAKKKYAIEESNTGTGAVTDNRDDETDSKSDEVNGTVEAPVHNNTESQPVNAEVEEFELGLPAEGVIAKGHDATIQVWSETMGDYRVHLGIDIATEEGAPVFAAADGKIEKIWDDALMGRCVAISHGDEIYTFYKNLNATLAEDLEVGSTVKKGQKIGKVGETAISELADEPHLHIEMTVNGLAVDPQDYLSDEAKDAISNYAPEKETGK
jgi:murein DD-endopeptidase MepM/ murein hydrolase activator NlpD